MRVSRKGKVIDVDIKDKRRCVEYEIHNRRKEKIDDICDNSYNSNGVSLFSSILGNEIDLKFDRDRNTNDDNINGGDWLWKVK